MPKPTKSASPDAKPASQPSAQVAASPNAPLAYSLDASAPGSVETLLKTEWLITNSLGGFAMGTCSGVPSRRYHGLLIAATSPPVGRAMTLAHTSDSLSIPRAGSPAQTHIPLSSFRFNANPNELHPTNFTRLERFEKDLSCRWIYRVRENDVDLRITRELSLIDAENTCQISFFIERLAGPSLPIVLSSRPLIRLFDMHTLIRRSWADHFHSYAAKSGVRACFADSFTQLHLQAHGGEFNSAPDWWYDFHYSLDAQRGQDHTEDLYSPGSFDLSLAAGESSARMAIQASLSPGAIADVRSSRARITSRRSAMRSAATRNLKSPLAETEQRTLTALLAASDDFVVARKHQTSGTLDQRSIIAGYPWFSDWGRDTAISAPGLLIAAGRLDDAKRCLNAFASHRKNGIVPNVFNDQTGEPEYNTVDASLWFILAACAFKTAATDLKWSDAGFFESTLAPACIDIIASYRKGTDFNIAMDPFDKLITAGSPSTQLTWMDARRDGVTFTPRFGKAVEINALWHAALRALILALPQSQSSLAANLTDLADNVAKNFASKFWNPAHNCLYDLLAPADNSSTGWSPIDDIRPNQLFAVSLPHSPLSPSQQTSVIECIKKHLLTPRGLRTLAPSSPAYQPRYDGSLFERDRAYHNGTAWPWLLGPYAEALLRTGNFSPTAKRQARSALDPILSELTTLRPGQTLGLCVGQIAEIYDAEPPQRPQGCPAQAWSVAEFLRIFLLTLN